MKRREFETHKIPGAGSGHESADDKLSGLIGWILRKILPVWADGTHGPAELIMAEVNLFTKNIRIYSYNNMT